MNRAKAILVTGAILKSVVADDDDSERRGLERSVLRDCLNALSQVLILSYFFLRMVAEAQRKRKEKGKKKPSASETTTSVV